MKCPEFISAQRFWRPSVLLQAEDQRKRAGQFYKMAASGFSAGLEPSGGWDGWLHRKVFRGAGWRQRSGLPVGFGSLAVMLLHSCIN